MGKKITIVFIILFVSMTSGYARTLELLTLQYPPYEYSENGEIKGIAVEIVREAFQRMEQPIQIKLYPWVRAIRMIEKGEADAIFTAYKNPTREEFSDYSKGVLMPQTVSLFVRKDSPIEFGGDLGELAEYHFGVVKGVSYGSIFDQTVKRGAIPKLDVAITGEINMLKLMKGRFDILVSNKYGALHILKQTGRLDHVRELSPEVQSVPSYITFSKKRNLSSVRDEFDIVLEEMKQDGSYDQIISDFFK